MCLPINIDKYEEGKLKDKKTKEKWIERFEEFTNKGGFSNYECTNWKIKTTAKELMPFIKKEKDNSYIEGLNDAQNTAKKELDRVRKETEQSNKTVLNKGIKQNNKDWERDSICANCHKANNKCDCLERTPTKWINLPSETIKRHKELIDRVRGEEWSATRMLWDRIDKWQKEWRKEKPKERGLVLNDALKLIEWKINRVREGERKKILKEITKEVEKDIEKTITFCSPEENQRDIGFNEGIKWTKDIISQVIAKLNNSQ